MTHGSRASYRAGCRCLPCRAANARYEHLRYQQDAIWLGAAEVCAHLRELRALGIGVRQAARLGRVAPSTVQALRSGQQQRVQADTARRLLMLPPWPALGVCISAWRTKRLIRALKAEGYTHRELAERLGLPSLRIRVHHRAVRVRTALKVERLYRQVTHESSTAP